MNEFEERINNVLSDPAQMEKLAGIARSIMGGESAVSGGKIQEDGIDPAMLAKLGSIISRGSGKTGDDRRLLEAMRPFLSEKRRGKLDRALKLARLAGIAELAADEFGGDLDDKPL